MVISQSYLIQPTTGWIVEPSDRQLTDPELMTLTLLANGLAQKQIAWEMGVTVRTVREHVVKAQEKLGARNRIHAVALALARGFVEVKIE
jgi:DNA-binding NarL/FixJ family response regulator